MFKYKVFPWRYVSAIERDIAAFIRGDIEESTRTIGKIANDLNIRPSRHIFKYATNLERTYIPLEIKGLNSRRSQPQIFSSGLESSGYKLIYGIFDYADSLHATILLDQNNEIVHRWIVDQDALSNLVEQQNTANGTTMQFRPESRSLSLGLEVLPDGSLIINGGHGGNGIYRIGLCGKFIWSQLGDFDHAVSLDYDQNTIWAFRAETLHEIDIDTGKILRQISLSEISRANPDISIFTTRRLVSTGKTLASPYHANDVEPLKKELADAFAAFDPGDLVIHLRSINLFYVLDPDSLKIKWWRSGISRLAHDPDWQPDGGITTYDNNARESSQKSDHQKKYDGNHIRFSRILRIDPGSFETRVIYDGASDNIYSKAKGTHQLLGNRNIFLTSPHQGRVLEVNTQGETVFEFVNQYNDDEILILTEARLLPLDYFKVDITNPDSCLQ